MREEVPRALDVARHGHVHAFVAGDELVMQHGREERIAERRDHEDRHCPHCARGGGSELARGDSGSSSVGESMRSGANAKNLAPTKFTSVASTMPMKLVNT